MVPGRRRGAQLHPGGREDRRGAIDPSYTIRQLEDRMGIRLLTRTTRNVATTAEGERLLKTIRPRIAEIEDEIAALTALRDKPSGSIRLTLSDHALESVVWPKLKPILRDYPDIGVELILDSTFRNIVEEGFDAGARLGESVERDMIAVRIGRDWRLVAVASLAYLDAHGVPEQFVCLSWRNAEGDGTALPVGDHASLGAIAAT